MDVYPVSNITFVPQSQSNGFTSHQYISLGLDPEVCHLIRHLVKVMCHLMMDLFVLEEIVLQNRMMMDLFVLEVASRN